MAGVILATAGVAQAVTHGSWLGGQPAALHQAAAGGPASAAGGGPASAAGGGPASATPVSGTTGHRHATASPAHPRASSKSPAAKPTPVATAAGYANPLRAVSDLIPERIDMGVDFGGTGPVYALGDAVITNADGDSAGWPGGGWITYRMTSGPARGLTIYLAEDVTPAVRVGQQVTSSTVIGQMFNGGAGIETGWAQPDSSSAESQLAAAGGISGGGPFPTLVGLNFEELLQKLGVPAASNRADAPSGLLPAGYPASWDQ